MRIKIKRGHKTNIFSTILWTITYRLLLDIVYYTQVSTQFGYTGLSAQFQMDRCVVSWALLFFAIPAMLACIKECSFSSAIILFLTFLSYIPFTTMTVFFPFSWKYILANSIYWAVLFLGHRMLPASNKTFDVMALDNRMMTYVIEAIFGLTILIISWRYTGFRFTVSLRDDYSMRSDENLKRIPLVLSYIFSASKAALPVLLTYSLSIKNKVNAAFIVLLQIMSFSINGSKTVLFSTLLAVMLFYLYNENYLSKVPAFMSGLCVISYLETVVLNSLFILVHFIRRVLFVPNQLNFYYFSFFTENEPDYYRQSFLRLLGIKSQYGDIDHMIGDLYFGRADMGANSGLISDAITNMGISGIVILPVVLAFLLRFMDICARGIEKKIYISVAVIISFIFISSFLPTILLTHGLIALCVILIILPREDRNCMLKL